MKNVYVFRNRLTGSFTDPEFRFESPEDYDKGLQRFIIIKPQEAVERHYDELELYHIGKYDDENGLIQQLDEPEFVNNYGPLCEQMLRRLNDGGNR